MRYIIVKGVVRFPQFLQLSVLYAHTFSPLFYIIVKVIETSDGGALTAIDNHQRTALHDIYASIDK